MKITKINIPITISILVSSLPVYANPMGLTHADMAFCSQVRDSRVREVVANSQSSTNGRFDTNFGFGFGSIGANGNSRGTLDKKSSSSSSDFARSEYQSKNCDTLLRTAGQVTIAQIEANSREAIARMQQESAMYSEDTKRLVAKIDLDAIKNTNATNRAIAADTNATNLAMTVDTNATNRAIAADTNKTNLGIAQTQVGGATNQTLITTVGGIAGSIIDSSTRKRESGNVTEVEKQRNLVDLEKARLVADTERQRIAAETERARIAAANSDPVVKLLSQWGWTRIACSPGAVFIMGMSIEAVCVNPTATFSPGQYTYNPASNQLLPAFSTPVQSAPNQPAFVSDPGGGI